MITTHKKNLIARCKERLYKLEEVMDCVVSQNGDIWTIDVDHAKYPHTIKQGVGTELKKFLSNFGIKTTPNCRCTYRAIEMNFQGIEWCKNNRELIVDWLEEEAKSRKLPFLRFAGRKAVDIAIRRSEKLKK
jgi:hypothetical protein